MNNARKMLIPTIPVVNDTATTKTSTTAGTSGVTKVTNPTQQTPVVQQKPVVQKPVDITKKNPKPKQNIIPLNPSNDTGIGDVGKDHPERLQRIQNISTDNKALVTYSTNLSRWSESLEQRIESLKERLEEQEATAVKEISRLENDLEASEKDRRLIDSKLSAEIDRLKEENEKQEKSIETKVNEIFKLNDDMRKLNSRIRELENELTDKGIAIPVTKIKSSFFLSEPLNIDSVLVHQQLSSAIRSLGYKGSHEMELHTGNSVIHIPHVNTTKNPVTQEPCFATLFDKKTKRHYGANETLADDVPLRRETVYNSGQMKVILRDEKGDTVLDQAFEYAVNTVENQRGYRISAGPINVYVNDLGAGTLKLKMISIDAMPNSEL